LATDLKIILLGHQNNYVERLSIDAAKSFNILATSLSVLIISMVQTKLFSDLYLAKFLDFRF